MLLVNVLDGLRVGMWRVVYEVPSPVRSVDQDSRDCENNQTVVEFSHNGIVEIVEKRSGRASRQQLPSHIPKVVDDVSKLNAVHFGRITSLLSDNLDGLVCQNASKISERQLAIPN